MNRSNALRRKSFWTRERVLHGLRLFYEDFGYTPLASEAFQDKRAFTGRTPDGRISTLPYHQKYPSMYGVLKHFRSMREAWTAAGFVVDKGYEEWSEMEDWFVIESCGVLPRDQVAELLGRTVPAVKRRLYDLGRFTAHTRWGITVSRAAHMLGIYEDMIRRYINHGMIPVFRGYKLIYLNPADLLKIKEVDWNNIPADLEERIRKAVAQRIVKILKFGPTWRDHEVYKFTPKAFTGRVVNHRTPALLKYEVPPKPVEINVGEWITTTQTVLGRKGRIGKVLAVHYSPQTCGRRDGTKRAAWVARIEFPRLRRSMSTNEKRISYSLPLDTLEKAIAPEIVTPQLKTNREAVRSRKRRSDAPVMAVKQFERIRSEVSL